MITQYDFIFLYHKIINKYQLDKIDNNIYDYEIDQFINSLYKYKKIMNMIIYIYIKKI